MPPFLPGVAGRQPYIDQIVTTAQGALAPYSIDIVTTRQANLHDEMMRLLGHGNQYPLPGGTALYAAAYRPLVRLYHYDVLVRRPR